MTTTLYLVRHGETAWSLSGQHTGRTDIPLTAHGEAQAHKLKPILEKIAFSAVFTSPLERAKKTCELAGLEATAVIDSDLAEWDYGDYEGRRTDSIRTTQPDWSVFRDGCPAGESPAQISERADRLITSLCTLNGNIALFSHGQFGCALAARWIGLPVQHGENFTFHAAALSILGYSPSHPEIRSISLWNFRAPL